MGELSKLPNIGKVVEEQLAQVGINTIDELACYNRLFALAGVRFLRPNKAKMMKRSFVVNFVRQTQRRHRLITFGQSIRLVASTVSYEGGSVALTWLKTSGASRYEVYRSYSKTGSYKRIAKTKKSSYTDKTLALGKTAYYKVRAIKKPTIQLSKGK